MKFKEYLIEKRKNNVICVDIQPMYKNYIHFDIYEFTQFLKEQGKILYYYNGPDTVGSDTKTDIINWLNEESNYDEELFNKLNSKNTLWYDKGYAFFRSWMDLGADVGFIKQAIRFMMLKKKNDSREIDPETWLKEFPDDYDDVYNHDPIYLPDIPLNVLKKWSGSYIVGGGKNECLKEVQLLMSIFNIKAKEVKKFIY